MFNPQPGSLILEKANNRLFYVHFNPESPTAFTPEYIEHIFKRGYIQGLDVHPSFWADLEKVAAPLDSFTWIKLTSDHIQYISLESYLDNPQMYHKLGTLRVELGDLINMELVWGVNNTIWADPLNLGIPRMAIEINPADRRYGSGVQISWEPHNTYYQCPYVTWRIDDSGYCATVSVMGKTGMLIECGQMVYPKNSINLTAISVSYKSYVGDFEPLGMRLQGLSALERVARRFDDMIRQESHNLDKKVAR